jgi:dGTPase
MNMRQSLYQECDVVRMRDEEKTIDPFKQDYYRVYGSRHFQILSGKTQMVPDTGQYHSRSTHSLEVCYVTYVMAGNVNEALREFGLGPVNKDLLKAASLAHDIGHPPFGHTGERTLDTIMAGMGGFESNAQTIKLLIENPFNVTYRTLGSLLKHRNRIPHVRDPYTGLVKGYYEHMAGTLDPLFSVCKRPVLEQDIVDIADTLSYVVSDMKDLVKLVGRHQFLKKVQTCLAELESLEEAELHFHEVGKRELQQMRTKAMEEIKEDLIGPIATGNKTRFINGHSFVRSVIRNLIIDIDPAEPRHSRLEMPLEDQLKILILKQLTRRCFLESPYNIKAEKRIDDAMKKTFDSLFQFGGETSWMPFDHHVIEKLADLPEDDEKARLVCDCICLLTDDQLIQLNSNLKKSTILV